MYVGYLSYLTLLIYPSLRELKNPPVSSIEGKS
jgi:hypothetical protein